VERWVHASAGTTIRGSEFRIQDATFVAKSKRELFQLTALLVYLCLINAAGYLASAWDKHSARHDLRRVPERSLLGLAAIGGTLGLMAAQTIHRHKTRKEPFRTYLKCIGGVQIILSLGVYFWWLHDLLS
jgi:uncharacterized membrane protein YsdA (DUF1294 family)